MMNCSFLFLCILMTCCIWTVKGRTLLEFDDEEVEERTADQKLPGLCWGCKWALKKIKKQLGPNANVETIKAKLKAICDGIGLLKSMCKKFVDSHLGVLIEELLTSDNVKTICVNTGACKSSDQWKPIFYPNN